MAFTRNARSEFQNERKGIIGPHRSAKKTTMYKIDLTDILIFLLLLRDCTQKTKVA